MADTPEIAALKAKIRARQNQPGFAQNVADLKARLAELEAASGGN